MTRSTLYYVHDPMCSWCWGHRPQWELLQAALPNSVSVKNLVGGLAPDSNEIMPLAQQQAISGYWHKIEALLGTQFNHDFWQKSTPRRSTYTACRAVIAARWQNAEEDMILAIQKAYYLNAQNPSDIETHLQLAAELGLNVDVFNQDIHSEKLEQAFIEELQLARSLPINGFPSMVLKHQHLQKEKEQAQAQAQVHVIPLNYQDYRPAITLIKQIIA